VALQTVPLADTAGRVPLLNLERDAASFFRRTDWFSVVIIAALTTWSVAAIFSTGSLQDPVFFNSEQGVLAQLAAKPALKQLFFVGIGWVAYGALALLNPAFLARFAWWIYAAGVALLLPMLLCRFLHPHLFGPFVRSASGAWRWIYLPGGFSIQPTEIAKVTTLLLVSVSVGLGVPRNRLGFLEKQVVRALEWLCERGPRVWRRFILPLREWFPVLTRVAWVSLLPCALVLLQPDLSSALTWVPVTLLVLFVAGVPARFFALLAALPVLLLPWIWADIALYERALEAERGKARTVAAPPSDTFSAPAAAKQRPRRRGDAAENIRQTHHGIFPFLRNYQRERIVALVHPDKIDRGGVGKNYQPQQARMAVARGGFSGQGYENGALARLGWLPRGAAHNDFLFSCIAEESGFIGGTSLIGLLGILVALALRTAAAASDRRGMCLAAGVAGYAAVQVVINIGMNIGLLPVTGLSLPFISYGGSSILCFFMLFGLAQGVHRASQPARPPPVPASIREGTAISTAHSQRAR